MARKSSQKTTRDQIIKTAVELFLENGFFKTTSLAICKRVGIATGNLTFYFPTKEHILAELVRIICEFQWEIVGQETNGQYSILDYCLEFTAMAAIRDERPELGELYIASYGHPITLNIIRHNDAPKLKQMFGKYCEGWTDEMFDQAEVLVSGIEFATLMVTDQSAPFEERISSAMRAVMNIFGVPEDVIEENIKMLFAMDYRATGRLIYEQFKGYAIGAGDIAGE